MLTWHFGASPFVKTVSSGSEHVMLWNDQHVPIVPVHDLAPGPMPLHVRSDVAILVKFPRSGDSAEGV